MKTYVLDVLLLAATVCLADIKVNSKEVSSFVYKGRRIRIYEVTVEGESIPPRPRYRYDPILTPSLIGPKNIQISVNSLGQNEWRTSFIMNLDDELARKLAFDKVTDMNSNVDIRLEDIEALPVTSVNVRLPDITDNHPSAKIVSPRPCPDGVACYQFHGSVSSFRVTFSSSSEEQANEIKKAIPYCELYFEMKTARYIDESSTVATVEFSQIKQSTVYSKLKGYKYVFPQDLVNLFKDFKVNVLCSGVTSAELATELVEEFKGRWSLISSEKFDKSAWGATYNSANIKQERLDEELKKILSYDEATNMYKLASGSSEDNVIVDVVKVEFKLKSELTPTELYFLLVEKDINVKLLRNVVLVRSVNLLRIDWSSFEESKPIVLSSWQDKPCFLNSGQISGYIDLYIASLTMPPSMPSLGRQTDTASAVTNQGNGISKGIEEAIVKIVMPLLRNVSDTVDFLARTSRLNDQLLEASVQDTNNQIKETNKVVTSHLNRVTTDLQGLRQSISEGFSNILKAIGNGHKEKPTFLPFRKNSKEEEKVTEDSVLMIDHIRNLQDTIEARLDNTDQLHVEHSKSLSRLLMSSSRSCDRAYVKDCTKNGCYCYHIITQPMNWDAAEANCRKAGGHLLSIHGQQEHDFIVELKKSYGTNFYPWIGLRFSRSEKHNYWSDGTDVTYTKSSNTCPKSIGVPDCVFLMGQLGFCTSDCLSAQPSVCKKPVLQD